MFLMDHGSNGLMVVDLAGGNDGGRFFFFLFFFAWVVGLWWLWYGWWVFGGWLGVEFCGDCW